LRHFTSSAATTLPFWQRRLLISRFSYAADLLTSPAAIQPATSITAASLTKMPPTATPKKKKSGHCYLPFF
jgi:hypothetical protein